jgi:hypothetical protein
MGRCYPTPRSMAGAACGSTLETSDKARRYSRSRGQVELDIVVPRPCQQRGIERVGLRCDQRFVRDAMDILNPARLGLQEVAQRGAIGFGRLLSIFLDRVPTIVQTLFIGVTILRDDRGDALRMLERETEPDRGAVIEEVDRKAFEPAGMGEIVNDAGQIVECVFELPALRRFREAEAWQIRSDHVVLIG